MKSRPDAPAEHLDAWRSRGVLFAADTSIWWMQDGSGAFFALPESDEIVRLYITGRDRSVRSRIGVVTIRWGAKPEIVDVSADPIFGLGDPGCFDMDGVSYPWIVRTEDALWMYYVGWSRLGGSIPFRNQIGLARSTDNGRTFQRVTRAPLLPMTDEEPIGSGSICVVHEPAGWRMYYTNFLRWELRSEGPRHYYHIREAQSEDGIHWSRSGKVVVDLVPPDEYALGAPNLYCSNGLRVLYFTARGERYRLFAAVQDPTGNWKRLQAPLALERSGFDSEMQCYPRTLSVGGKDYLLYAGNGYGRTGVGFAESAKP